MDWKKVKCSHCKSRKVCRRENVTKGSRFCQEQMKLIPKKQTENAVSEDKLGTAMVFNMLRKSKEGKK